MDLELREDIVAKRIHFRVIIVYIEFKAMELMKSHGDECRHWREMSQDWVLGYFRIQLGRWRGTNRGNWERMINKVG